MRRKRVLVKNTKEEKQKAIDFYIRYCNQATKVIKELGYPNKRHTLVSWYRGYEEKGEVKDDGREEKAVEDLINDSRAEGRSEGIVEGRAEGEASAIFKLRRDGLIQKEIAAERLRCTIEEYERRENLFFS